MDDDCLYVATETQLASRDFGRAGNAAGVRLQLVVTPVIHGDSVMRSHTSSEE